MFYMLQLCAGTCFWSYLDYMFLVICILYQKISIQSVVDQDHLYSEFNGGFHVKPSKMDAWKRVYLFTHPEGGAKTHSTGVQGGPQAVE